MKQFPQFIILILLSTNLHLSASNFNRNDTIGKFNEVTDIELRLKTLLDTTQTSNILEVELQDTITSILQDSLLITLENDTLLIPTKSDSVKIDKTALTPKKKQGFIPIVIKTSLDSLYTRKLNGTIQLPEEAEVSYDSYVSILNFRQTH